MLKISLDAVRHNYKTLVKQAPGAEVAPVVKADAYGLGAGQIAPVLWQAGARSFYVATPEEAISLRAHVPDAEILCLHGFRKTYGADYHLHRIVPVLNDAQQWQNFNGFCAGLGQMIPYAVHVDTGMNRLGFRAEDLLLLCADQPELATRCSVLVSHFIESEVPDSPYNAQQFEKFQQIAVRFPKAKKSLCNSSGVFLSPDYHLGQVRSGMAIYGLNPVPYRKNPMQDVVALQAEIIQIDQYKKGETVGYNATYGFDKNGCRATVQLGYADGLLRSLGNAGALYWQDFRCPIRGRISMDLVVCDLEPVPEGHRPHAGDYMEVIGPHQSVDDLARDAGTIGYEILTSLGTRYPRYYI